MESWQLLVGFSQHFKNNGGLINTWFPSAEDVNDLRTYPISHIRPVGNGGFCVVVFSVH
jgi:hypothetical protein